MSPASYQTAPPRNVWAHRVREKEIYRLHASESKGNAGYADFSTFAIDTPCVLHRGQRAHLGAAGCRAGPSCSSSGRSARQDPSARPRAAPEQLLRRSRMQVESDRVLWRFHQPRCLSVKRTPPDRGHAITLTPRASQGRPRHCHNQQHVARSIAHYGK